MRLRPQDGHRIEIEEPTIVAIPTAIEQMETQNGAIPTNLPTKLGKKTPMPTTKMTIPHSQSFQLCSLISGNDDADFMQIKNNLRFDWQLLGQMRSI